MKELCANPHSGLRLDQAKRLKELEKENGRLKKLVADQALDNAILKEVSSGGALIGKERKMPRALPAA